MRESDRTTGLEAALLDGLEEAGFPPDTLSIVQTETRLRYLIVTVEAGDGRRLFAKLARPDGPTAVTETRPRLIPLSPTDERLAAEAEALRRLERAIPADDPRFGTVSVVHWQESPAMLVVDWVEGAPLSKTLSPLSPAGRHRNLVEAAGQWLEIFQSLDAGEPMAYKWPGEMAGWLAAARRFLAATPGGDGFGSLAATLEAHLERVPDLPAGLHHGDMAARNLMLGDDGRLVGIDAGAMWRTPRAHDVGTFLVDTYLRSPLRNNHEPYRVAFLEGMGRDLGDTPDVDFFFGVSVVDRALAWATRTVGPKRRVRHAIEKTRLASLARLANRRLAAA